MSSSLPPTSGRDRVHCFEQAQAEVNRLDFAGKEAGHDEVYRQYQRRNAFGPDPNMRIYRIFQEHYYQKDVADGCLTLPRATANVWNDPLENPLASVMVTDPQTRMPLHLGSTVSGFYALCWTRRALPTDEDWASFSHGEPVITVNHHLDAIALGLFAGAIDCGLLRIDCGARALGTFFEAISRWLRSHTKRRRSTSLI